MVALDSSGRLDLNQRPLRPERRGRDSVWEEERDRQRWRAQGGGLHRPISTARHPARSPLSCLASSATPIADNQDARRTG